MKPVRSIKNCPLVPFALLFTVQEHKRLCTKFSDGMRVSLRFLFRFSLLCRGYNSGSERRIQSWIQSWIAGEQVQNSGTIVACEDVTT